ncbi:MAG: type 1 glutamine amidotransferase [bacterium]|nr:type 1 glutamine amidotransferase [bacterium]
MSKKRKILFLDILTDDVKKRKRIEKYVYRGATYADRIRRVCGIAENAFAAVDASKKTFPDPSGYRAIIIGGSTEDPVKGKEKTWMKKAYAFIRRAAKKRVPIFGICGGMQFTVRALGGTVVNNKKGRHFGNANIQLTREGIKSTLFEGIGNTFTTQCNHRCIVDSIKPEWKVLAFSAYARIEALAIGERIYLVEFHPERDLWGARASARMQKEALLYESLATEKNFRMLVNALKDTSGVGRKILKNFIERIV